MDADKRTPLHHLYGEYGAKTTSFGGWELPVSFTSILSEHRAVRAAAGLFDVSHMGEIEFSGTGATATLQWLVTNDVARMEVGQALYSPCCDPEGGTIDDLVIYKLADDRYFVVVNAANKDADFAWFCAHNRGAVIRDVSDDTVLLALQGPLAQAILQPLSEVDLSELRYYHCRENILVGGIPVLLSRTGYTGEDGFELYAARTHGPDLYRALVVAGADAGMQLAGLGARDTLRLEARMPLYGHELTREITPLEAGLDMFVKFDKGDFCGREALLEQVHQGVKRRLVGFAIAQRAIARAGQPVFAEGELIGHVTSGTHSPTLGYPIGLALVESAYAHVGTPIAIDVRGQRIEATIVKTPFYRRKRSKVGV
ncbi:MAG: glycine cleavage system aminomethyltransferase GcvT [Firmicutes bacterium]|nr:glycine cleavage system aminomethyltransferase GcvT [Bacillota bacterium]